MQSDDTMTLYLATGAQGLSSLRATGMRRLVAGSEHQTCVHLTPWLNRAVKVAKCWYAADEGEGYVVRFAAHLSVSKFRTDDHDLLAVPVTELEELNAMVVGALRLELAFRSGDIWEHLLHHAGWLG